MYKYLEWDTEFFGIPVARCEPHDITSFEDAISQAKRDFIRCMYVLIDAKDTPLIQHLLGQEGASQVDLRLTFGQATASIKEETESGAPILATTADLTWLMPLARQAHLDSRFFTDSRFPEERVRDLYATWITRSVGGWAQRVFTARREQNGEALGYVTAHVDGVVGNIGLVAMSASARGQGIGTRLIRQALGWFKDQGMEHIEVVTQGRNVGAQRLYQHTGFRTTKAQLWFHLWL